MAHKGQTGTSLGGGIVGRKQLKAQHKPDLPPVDPETLNVEARKRREEYEAEQRDRQQAAIAAQEERVRKQREDRLAQMAAGKRVINAAHAVSRHRP